MEKSSEYVQVVQVDTLEGVRLGSIWDRSAAGSPLVATGGEREQYRSIEGVPADHLVDMGRRVQAGADDGDAHVPTLLP